MRLFANRNLCFLFLFLLGAGCADQASKQEETKDTAAESATRENRLRGRWRPFHAPAPQADDAAALTPEQQESIRRLQSLGYASGSRTARTNEVIPVHDPERSYEGVNFFTSGHAPEAFLVDMQGKLLHRWRKTFDEAWPEGGEFRREAGSHHWRQALLMPNGDILAIFEGSGLIKLDKDSNLIWARGNRAHHDLRVTENGDIYVLARIAHLVPRVHPTEPILEDYILVLDSSGREKRRVSVLECFEGSEFEEHGLRQAHRGGDLFHTNALEILPPDGNYTVPWLKPGYILTSLLTTSLLAVIDLDRETVVRAWQGSFRRQHDPSLTGDGTILLFDNMGLESQSRALEIDPIDMRTSWEYRGTEQIPLASRTCGTAQRLPNGNTLITESDNGHAVEVTREGDVVWEFYNPHRVQADRVLIATLFEMHRLGPEFPLDWVGSEKN